MYSLVASDLDGTLLLPDDTVGEFSRSVIERLIQTGKQVVIATGRCQPDVESILRSYNLPVHLITSNGAKVTSACKQLNVVEHLPEDIARRVLEETRHDADLVLNQYCQSQWITSASTQLLEEFNQNDEFEPTVKAIDEFHTVDVEKIFFIHKDQDHEALVVLDERLKSLFGDQVSSTFSAPWCLEIMASSVSKDNALQRLADFLEIPMSRCIAFGDGMNDVEMLSRVGKGLVMGTAHSKVLKALPDHETIGSCVDESVAHYLSTHLL